MALEIFWSPEAQENLSELILYLKENWNDQVVQKFSRKLNSVLDTISEFPEIYFIYIKSGGIRRAVVTKQVSLFYRIIKNEVEIISLLDNRMNPKTIRKILRKKK